MRRDTTSTEPVAGPDTARSAGEPPAESDEERFLDNVLDRMVGARQRCEPFDIDPLIAARPALADRVREQARLAESIAPRPRSDAPLIEGYTIVSEAGRGGMGTVYLARQDRLGGRAVALKVLSGSAALTARARQRFRQESEIVARLRHPNIVAVHDVADGRDAPAYAMEWIEGRSLASIIDRAAGQRDASAAGIDAWGALRRFIAGEDVGREDVPAAGVLAAESYVVFVCRVGLAIASALSAVHRAGLLHRDVKPSNVLIRRDGVPLLTDFGLAREQDAAVVTRDGEFLGTVAYAPPEQLRGDSGSMDARSDVYALGSTLYHALAFRLPFGGASTGTILRQIESGRLTPLRKANPRVPRDLETIVTKAMEHDPARRYQTAAELADDLERLLSFRPVRARPSGIAARMWKFSQRNRGAAAGVSAGVLAAFTVASIIVAYVFVLPVLAARNLAAARNALINPKFGELTYVFKADLNDSGPIPAQYAAAIARCESALGLYNRALIQATGRSLRGAIELERDTVEAARLVLARDRDGAGLPGGLVARAPRTAQAAGVWITSPGARLDDDVLVDAAPDDRRALGLLAYLCLRAGDAISAWEKWGDDLREPADPLVNGAMGQAYVVFGEWHRATIRLVRANALLPNNAAIRRVLALSAFKSGEAGLAERTIEQAEAGREIDGPKDLLTCVKAGLLARRGEVGNYDLACSLFEQHLATTIAPGPYRDYAEARLENHDPVGAMDVYRRLAIARPNDRASLGMFVRGVRRCWSMLGEARRAELIGGSEMYRSVWALDRQVRSRYSAEQLRDPGDRSGAPVPPLEDLETPAPAPAGG